MVSKGELSKTIEDLLFVDSAVNGTHDPTRCKIKFYAIRYHELTGLWYHRPYSLHNTIVGDRE